MILNGGGWHYLAVRKLSAFLKGITSKHNGNFYFLNCLKHFRTENKLKSHKKISCNKGFCGVLMSFEDTKILELN